MFSKLEALSFKKHQHLRYKPVANFFMTTNLTNVPITYSEIPIAAKYYPIVFPPNAAAELLPHVLLGLSEATGNAFVHDDGEWKQTYIPAYIRRYPFILGAGENANSFTVMADVEAPHFKQKNGEALFSDDGNPGPVIKRSMQFLRCFQEETQQTKVFVNSLIKEAILIPQQLSLDQINEKKVLLQGFQVVDQQRFADLPDAVFLDWRKRGILPLIYAHLQSLSNTESMVKQWAQSTSKKHEFN